MLPRRSRRQPAGPVIEIEEEVLPATIAVRRKPGTEITEAGVRALVGAVNVTKVEIEPRFVRLTFAADVERPWRIAERLGRRDQFLPMEYDD